MDKIQNVLFLFVLSFFLYTPMKRSIHMYQQNRYQIKRYETWLVHEIKYKRVSIQRTFLCLLGVYGLFFVSHEELPLQLLILLLLIYSYIFLKMEDMKEYRKPIVFTHRVQRLLFAFYLFYTVCFVFLLQVLSNNNWIACVPFLYFSPWVFLMIIAYLMQPIEERIRMYFVKDAQKILRNHKHLRCVGITGSYGKTSIKNILHTLLSDTYYTLQTPHSYNNMMGITLSIRQHLQNLHEIFICEMGADHVHEIENLMEFVQPQYGFVSAVGPQHLSTFHSIENILHEKMQMIEKLPKDGIGFINYDNPYIREYKIQNTCTVVTYGTRPECKYRAANITYSKAGSSFDVVYQKERHTFSCKLLGRHNVVNITGAIAVAHTLHVSWDVLKQLVSSLSYVEHRLQIIENEAYTIIDNAYNSNPEGAHYALEVMKQLGGKRVIVTPGFLDLGKDSKQAHYEFGCYMAQCVDEVILVGKQQTKDIVVGLREKKFPLSRLHIVSTIQEAFSRVNSIATPDTTVLLENDLPDAFNH